MRRRSRTSTRCSLDRAWHRRGAEDARRAGEPVTDARGPQQDADAAPLGETPYYPHELDVPRIAELWRRGRVVASWLLDLIAAALVGSPELEEFAGRVSDSGEGRWTVHAALDGGVPAPVLSVALYQHCSSRGEDDYAARLLSAMRRQFGRHLEQPV